MPTREQQLFGTEMMLYTTTKLLGDAQAAGQTVLSHGQRIALEDAYGKIAEVLKQLREDRGAP